jgi:Ca2+-binding EF-hand superfamily protein
MEANSNNFSILVENEEQFNRVWSYVKYYFPNYKNIEYNELNPVGIIFNESPTWVKLMQSMDKNIHTSISWKQFLEYEKKMEKKEEQKVIPIEEALEILGKEKNNKQIIADLIKIINMLIRNLPDNEALKVTFNSEGEDVIFYLDNLTMFTSLKSIFNSKELL